MSLSVTRVRPLDAGPMGCGRGAREQSGEEADSAHALTKTWVAAPSGSSLVPFAPNAICQRTTQPEVHGQVIAGQVVSNGKRVSFRCCKLVAPGCHGASVVMELQMADTAL